MAKAKTTKTTDKPAENTGGKVTNETPAEVKTKTEDEVKGVKPAESGDVEPNAADKLDDGESVAVLPASDEVLARSADQVKPSTEYTKAFVLGPGDYTKATDYDHEPNKAGTRQEALNRGLWPTGDVTFVSNKPHMDGKSRVLTYKVPVRPAADFEATSPHPTVVAADGDAEGAVNADPEAVERSSGTPRFIDPRGLGPARNGLKTEA